jgi:hypothetical protein
MVSEEINYTYCRSVLHCYSRITESAGTSYREEADLLLLEEAEQPSSSQQVGRGRVAGRLRRPRHRVEAGSSREHRHRSKQRSSALRSAGERPSTPRQEAETGSTSTAGSGNGEQGCMARREARSQAPERAASACLRLRASGRRTAAEAENGARCTRVGTVAQKQEARVSDLSLFGPG